MKALFQKWTDAEIAIVKAFWSSKPIEEIATMIDRSPVATSAYATNYLGLKKSASFANAKQQTDICKAVIDRATKALLRQAKPLPIKTVRNYTSVSMVRLMECLQIAIKNGDIELIESEGETFVALTNWQANEWRQLPFEVKRKPIVGARIVRFGPD